MKTYKKGDEIPREILKAFDDAGNEVTGCLTFGQDVSAEFIDGTCTINALNDDGDGIIKVSMDKHVTVCTQCGFKAIGYNGGGMMTVYKDWSEK